MDEIKLPAIDPFKYINWDAFAAHLNEVLPRIETMAKWEDSKADRAVDRKGAKKAGVPMKKWEGSTADRKLDRKAEAKMKGKK